MFAQVNAQIRHSRPPNYVEPGLAADHQLEDFGDGVLPGFGPTATNIREEPGSSPERAVGRTGASARRRAGQLRQPAMRRAELPHTLERSVPVRRSRAVVTSVIGQTGVSFSIRNVISGRPA
jgi:hypothetical protein